MIGIWIALTLIAFVVLVAFIKAHLEICAPNELLIFSGRKRELDDGTTVGYRIIKGGRAFRVPIVESVRRMSLQTIPLEIELTGALSRGEIAVNVEAAANVKIAGTEEAGMAHAVERFLDTSRGEIARIARETLEGSLRGVLATMNPEEANTDRLEFADRVKEEARKDLRRLGLILDTFKIQNISDEEDYLEAIGRKRNAEVQRDARIAEAESDAEARKVAARAKEEGRVAETEAEEQIVEAENRLRVRKADVAAEGNQAEARAEVAGQIARVDQEQQLEEKRIALNERRNEAEVVVPARAEKEAEELRAEGRAAEIHENGKATAEAVRRMREQWEEGETRELFMLQQLPDIIDKMTRVVADNLSIEKLTVLDGGGQDDGLPQLTRSLTGSVVSMMEEMENATGLDIPELLGRERDSSPNTRV